MVRMLTTHGVALGRIHGFRAFVANMSNLSDDVAGASLEAFSIRMAARRRLQEGGGK